MNAMIGALAIWLGPALLAWIFFSSGWLNQRGFSAARAAERIAWGGFASVLAALGLWLSSSPQAIGITLGEGAFFGVRLDPLTSPLLLLVAFLGAIVLRFSRNYLEGDPRQGHFIKWMCITLGSVAMLVTAPGLVQLGFAWIATSLGLHKLLVFFPQRHGTLYSARKKFLLSRIGDLSLLAAFVGLYLEFGSENFSQIFASLATQSSDPLNYAWIGWLIAIGALLKSAQFPFHTWLPDTMGTPTPVSALMHAGIINAGGILVVRLSPVLVETPAALHAIAIVGAFTAIFAAFVMLSQNSIKRSLAYSTIAQMGFMLLQCGLGAFHLAVLHIVAHSLYKAHSFLSSGSSVQTIHELGRQNGPTRVPRGRFLATITAAGLIVSGLSFLFGLGTSSKPGLIVFSVAVTMAATQIIWNQVRRSASATAIVSAGTVAIAFAATYLLLAKGAEAWLSGTLPWQNVGSFGFELGLAICLLLALATSLRLQDGSSALLPQRLREALYTHAVNGFYMNTIANRTLRALKLHPNKTA